MKTGFTYLFALVFFFSPVFAFAETEAININTADLKTLTQLVRVGPKYAQKIIEYREANGPFKRAEDIQLVSGIGPKTYQVNMDRLVVEDASTKEELPPAEKSPQTD